MALTERVKIVEEFKKGWYGRTRHEELNGRASKRVPEMKQSDSSNET